MRVGSKDISQRPFFQIFRNRLSLFSNLLRQIIPFSMARENIRYQVFYDNIVLFCNYILDTLSVYSLAVNHFSFVFFQHYHACGCDVDTCQIWYGMVWYLLTVSNGTKYTYKTTRSHMIYKQIYIQKKVSIHKLEYVHTFYRNIVLLTRGGPLTDIPYRGWLPYHRMEK